MSEIVEEVEMTDEEARRYWGKLIDRFTSKFEIGNEWECWEWKGGKSPNGYGRFLFDGEVEYAHRVAFFLSMGFLPEDGKIVMHDCDNRLCVNPYHLREGTHKENAQMRDWQTGYQRDYEGRSKLTEYDVAMIKVYLKNREFTQRELAEMYDVAITTIQDISSGKTWAHVNVVTMPA